MLGGVVVKVSEQAWTEAVSRVDDSVRGSTWSDNSSRGVVVYGISTLRARNGSYPSDMASNLSIRAIHDYSDGVFLFISTSLRKIIVSSHFGYDFPSSLSSRMPSESLHLMLPSLLTSNEGSD